MNPAAVTQAAAASPLWPQLAASRLRLRDTVRSTPLSFRNEPWFLFQDGLERLQFRVRGKVAERLLQLDGRQTLAEVLDMPPGEAPDDEWLTTITQLHAAGMLVGDDDDPVVRLLQRQHEHRQRSGRARWLRLLSPRFALFDPDRLLDRLVPWTAWLFHPATLVLWLLLVVLAGAQALMHAGELALYGAQRFDDPGQWLLLLALYPAVKALHELGHGITAKMGGARVNEMGITLLVFMPVPYVDASATSAFSNKYRRMLVGAAGIIVELVLAAIALLAWLGLEDGPAREVAFSVMLIGGMSTLLFNGNPLLRFDGYYVLSDALEIPNLATRATRYYAYLVKRYLLDIAGQVSPLSAHGERRWLIVYAPASLAYRLLISFGIAFFLVDLLPVVGVLLAVWLLSVQWLLPLLRQLRFLFADTALQGRRVRAVTSVAAIVAIATLLFTLLPLAQRTSIDGVVLLPEQAIVRAQGDGFLSRQLVEDATRVLQGDLLFVFDNAELATDVAVLEARVRELRARLDGTRFGDRNARRVFNERLVEAEAELAEVQRRLAALEVRSPGDGYLQLAVDDDDLGRYVHEGDMLAYLAGGGQSVVRVVATQDQASRIRAQSDRIRVRFADPASREYRGQLLREVPQASAQLPTAALGSRGGGAIQVDARDASGVTTLQPVFAFDIALDDSEAGRFVGRRAFVRIEHDAEPLLMRVHDWFRRTLIDRAGV
ncbi:MAG: hypothetical protein KDI82_06910 [Gammaproteobacteria bacterium]|nr:hypothetical protein [Gammaproteobacteria bacterium]